MKKSVPKSEIALIKTMVDSIEDRLWWGAENECGECAFYRNTPPQGLKVITAIRKVINKFDIDQ